MERLTAMDLSMLWPDEFGWPQDIGALAILDGSTLLDSDGRFRIDAVRAAVPMPMPRAWRDLRPARLATKVPTNPVGEPTS